MKSYSSFIFAILYVNTHVILLLIRRSHEFLCVMQSSGPSLDRGTGYSLHQLQGDKQAGMTRTGHLMKKSEGKMRRVWQKRRCCVQAEGFLEISHGDETKPPTRVNLLTCQVKMVPDDKRCFDVLSCKLFHYIFNLVFMLVK